MSQVTESARASRVWIGTALCLCLAVAACDGPLAPSPAPDTVDVLDFLIGDATLWPRAGSQYMNQVVDSERQEVCWVKYANPRRFECWRWDAAFVYHETDNAVDGNTGESYHFSDGRWMPRRLPVGQGTAWSLDVPANTLTWFTPDCRMDAARSGGFPYRQRAWLERQIDAGGDVGVRDAVVLEYSPYDPVSGRSNPERFYFARGAGWFMWQRQGVESTFVRRSPFVVMLNRDVWCGSGATQ